MRIVRRPWLALTIGFLLTLPAARADFVTPDSIPTPPSSVGSANGTDVYANGVVTSHYNRLGLNFAPTSGSTTAITNLNGVAVWAPATPLASPPIGIGGGPPIQSPAAQLSYYGAWGGASFVVPGTTIPAVATSLSVEIIGNQQASVFVHYVNNSNVAIPASIGISSLPNGGTLYTFPAGTGITSFSVTGIVPNAPGAVHSASVGDPSWGVAEVAFTLAHAPEPSSLFLAGWGVLGLAARFGWRRTRNEDY